MFRDSVKGSELFPFIFVDVKREESNLLLLIGMAATLCVHFNSMMGGEKQTGDVEAAPVPETREHRAHT